jgi:hypothetical protein
MMEAHKDSHDDCEDNNDGQRKGSYCKFKDHDVLAESRFRVISIMR